MPEPTHSAFISYCRDDQEFALRLAQDLKDAGAAVWLDQLDIKPGHPWDNAVEEALRNATQMLVVLTPTSVSSENVRDEIAYALRQGKIVIPVLYMECVIPLRLERKQHIDFRANYARGLELLLRELRVDHPNPAVLEKAAEGDTQRQAAWQAREAEAQRLLEDRQQQEDTARRVEEETLRREQEAEARIQADREQKKAEADRLAGEAEARHRRELEQQQATEAAERLAAQEATRRQQQAATPPPIVPAHLPPNTLAAPIGVSSRSIPLWLKSGWTAFGALALILIVYFAFFHNSPPPPADTSSQPAAVETPQLPAATDPATPVATPPDPTALYKQGFALYSVKRYLDAQPLLMQACDAGNANACNVVGLMYDTPFGVAQDQPRAVALYKKACDGGSAAGCDDLGLMYKHGTGIAQDYVKALAILTKACDGDDGDGCSNLGTMYDGGFGVTKDSARALTLYTRGCDSGVAQACSNAGGAYRLGSGVTANPGLARQYLQKACNMGNADGCDQLKKL